jgi:hypothetical protein
MIEREFGGSAEGEAKTGSPGSGGVRPTGAGASRVGLGGAGLFPASGSASILIGRCQTALQLLSTDFQEFVDCGEGNL